MKAPVQSQTETHVWNCISLLPPSQNREKKRRRGEYFHLHLSMSPNFDLVRNQRLCEIEHCPLTSPSLTPSTVFACGLFFVSFFKFFINVFFFAIAQVLHGHFNAPTIEFAKILIRLQLLFYRRCSRLPSVPRLLSWCVSTSGSVARREKNKQTTKKNHRGPWTTRSDVVQNSQIPPRTPPYRNELSAFQRAYFCCHLLQEFENNCRKSNPEWLWGIFTKKKEKKIN